MENLVPLGTGNSRLMKSNIPASTTLAQLIQMLNNGTFPYDIGPLNPVGISQQGTPLNKATLFSDTTAALYPEGVNNPNDAFEKLSKAGLIASNSEETTTQTYYLTDIFGNKVSVGPQIYTGSYTGTGTGTVTLTFPFKPGLVVVGFNPEFIGSQYLLILTPAMSGLRACTMGLPNNDSNDAKQMDAYMVEVISFSGDSVSFGRPEYPASVNPGILNDSGTNYWFTAIG